MKTIDDACGFVESQGQVFFVARTIVEQYSLWKSDATPGGTVRVAGAVHVPYFPEDFALLPVAGRVIFPRRTAEHGVELWWTDGIRVELLLDMVPGDGFTDFGSSSLRGIEFNGRAYFAAETAETGLEPWSSDGRPEGTTLLANIREETRNGDGVGAILGATSSGVFFSGRGPGSGDGYGLWVSDGLQSGTRKVRDFDLGTDAQLRNGKVYRDCLFFSTNFGGLWVSDGTAGGTNLLRPINYTELHANDAGLIISSGEWHPEPNIDLWRSDGTEAGTVPLADISIAADRTRPEGLLTVGPWVYYSAGGPNGDIGLWRTDPKSGASEFLGEVDVTRGSGARLVALGERVIFSASDRDAGTELWQYDGSRLSRITDIFAGYNGSSIGELTVFGNEVWFTAYDGQAVGLWAFDGTRVRQVAAAQRFSGSHGMRSLSVVNNKLYLVADVYQDSAQFSVFDSPTAHIRPLRTQDGARLQPRFIGRLDADEVFLADARANLFRPFIADDRQVVQLRTQVEIRDPSNTLVVPEGPAAGIWFKGYTEAEGVELWRVR